MEAPMSPPSVLVEALPEDSNVVSVVVSKLKSLTREPEQTQTGTTGVSSGRVQSKFLIAKAASTQSRIMLVDDASRIHSQFPSKGALGDTSYDSPRTGRA